MDARIRPGQYIDMFGVIFKETTEAQVNSLDRRTFGQSPCDKVADPMTNHGPIFIDRMTGKATLPESIFNSRRKIPDRVDQSPVKVEYDNRSAHDLLLDRCPAKITPARIAAEPIRDIGVILSPRNIAAVINVKTGLR